MFYRFVIIGYIPGGGGGYSLYFSYTLTIFLSLPAIAEYIVCVQCMSLYLNMANVPVKIWGKLSQYALQILDFTLNIICPMKF